MIIQFKVLGLLFLANIAMGNLGELNSIFSTYTHPRESSTCNSIGEPFQRHTVINNIEKAMEIGLNKSFHEKYICLQKVFDEKLIEMQQAYKQSAQESSATNTEVPVKGSKHQSKLHKYHGELADHFIGQTGFIFYSIDQNGTITDFKHESFKFVKPVTNLSDSSLLESELAAFNSDLFALKALSNNIKKNIRLRMNLLKAIETNEKELELEQKEQEKLLKKGQETAGSDATSSKKELKKLKKQQKQKTQADVEVKEEKTKEKRNVDVESGVDKKSESSSPTEQSVSQDAVKKTEIDATEKTKRDQKSSSKNKTKKDKKNKSKSSKNKSDKSAKRNKSSGKAQDVKSSQAKSSPKESPKM